MFALASAQEDANCRSGNNAQNVDNMDFSPKAPSRQSDEAMRTSGQQATLREQTCAENKNRVPEDVHLTYNPHTLAHWPITEMEHLANENVFAENECFC